MVFPFKEKGFPCKSLCSYVVVLLLCLLKFIHSYIEFFSQQELGGVKAMPVRDLSIE